MSSDSGGIVLGLLGLLWLGIPGLAFLHRFGRRLDRGRDMKQQGGAMRLPRRSTLVERLARRTIGLRGDLVDELAGWVAREDSRLMWRWLES
jgi:hypothetical protein